MISRLPGGLLPGQLIPFPLQKVALERALALMFREQLRAGSLDFLKGRWLAIVVEDIGFKWLITRKLSGLEVRRDGVKPDVTFRACLQEFILVASRRQDPDTLFFQRRLSVTGDTALGLACKNLMDAIEWDRWPLVGHGVLQHAADWIESRTDYGSDPRQ